MEVINRVVLNPNNELVLGITGRGNPSYQYVYREAAGVYWDQDQIGFKSTPLGEWTISKWFFHIKAVVKEGLNVDLKIYNNVTWENISIAEQKEKKRATTKPISDSAIQTLPLIAKPL